MNYILKIKGLVLLAALVVTGSQALAEEDSLDKERGYFFGYSFGNMLKEGGNPDVDLNSLLEGIRDSLENAAPNLTQEQQQSVIEAIRQRQALIAEQREAQADQMGAANLDNANAFLASNGQTDGVMTTESGLQYKTVSAGDGASPTPESTVVVHYTGRLLGPDGKITESEDAVFDSSYQRGEAAEFKLNQVIPGWTEGLQLMKAGGKTRFYIPPGLAYGPGGTRGIPPNSLLVFDVELLEVK